MASAASPETAGQQRLDGVVGRIADVEKDTADDAVLPGRADDLDGQRERLALRHRHLEAQALADAEIVRLPIGGVERYTEAGGTEIGKLHGPPVEQSLGLPRAATVAPAVLAHYGDVAAAPLPPSPSLICFFSTAELPA